MTDKKTGERLYKVSFDTRRDNVLTSWKSLVYAPNMRQARDIVEYMWYDKSDMHMFHIKVSRTDEKQTEEAFVVVHSQTVSWGRMKKKKLALGMYDYKSE